MMPKNFKQILFNGGKGKKLSLHSLIGFVRTRNCSSSSVNQYHYEETAHLGRNSCESGAEVIVKPPKFKSNLQLYLLGLDETSGSLSTNIQMKPVPSVKGFNSSQKRHFSSAVNQSEAISSFEDVVVALRKHLPSSAVDTETIDPETIDHHFLKPLSSYLDEPANTETRATWTIGLFNTLFRHLSVAKDYSRIVYKYKEMMGFGFCQPDIRAINMVINSFCRLNQVDVGFSMLAVTLKIGISPDAYAFNTLIGGLCQQGRIEEAVLLFEKMQLGPNVFAFNKHNHEIRHLAEWEEYRRFFRCRVDRGISPNVATYNILISCLSEKGRIQEAFSIFERMIGGGMKPDLDTYTSLISASCKSDIVKFSTVFNALCKEWKTSEALNALKEMVIHRGQVPHTSATFFEKVDTILSKC